MSFGEHNTGARRHRLHLSIFKLGAPSLQRRPSFDGQNSLQSRPQSPRGQWNRYQHPLFDSYQKTRLTRADLSPMTSPLYKFTEDHVVPEGTIKLAVTLGEYTQVATIVTKFFAVNCPSAFNGVLGRPLLHATKSVTLIHYLTMKFPTGAGTCQVRGR